MMAAWQFLWSALRLRQVSFQMTWSWTWPRLHWKSRRLTRRSSGWCYTNATADRFHRRLCLCLSHLAESAAAGCFFAQWVVSCRMALVPMGVASSATVLGGSSVNGDCDHHNFGASSEWVLGLSKWASRYWGSDTIVYGCFRDTSPDGYDITTWLSSRYNLYHSWLLFLL